ncbi:MAG: divalent-cation tolerance protein CutA [Parvularculaceae bacterium]
MPETVLLLYVTAPDPETAERIGRTLVEDRLAACVNILPRMQSVYRWNDALESAEEAVMIVKTTERRAAAARDRILSLHPYDEPCVLALPVAQAGSASGFLDWIAAETCAQGLE